MPLTTLKLLQDRGSVGTLSGDPHRVRKSLFLSQLDAAAVVRLAGAVEDHWRRAAQSWEAAGRVVLHDAVEGILCRAACEWAGVPLWEAEAGARTREFSAMIDGSGSVGLRALRGTVLRRRTERWMRGVIEKVRSGAIDVPEGVALHAVAHHQDAGGNPLDPESAAVELINLTRPVVAVAKYVTFAALALHQHPECREGVRDGEYLNRFAQEVRRFYPFFPVVGGRALAPFEWRGHRFERGAWVLFDLYGTNHDPRLWDEPDAFRPERFARRPANPFDFVPQGAGDPATGHRCPGESAAVEIIKVAARMMAGGMRYDVPEQDLSVNLSRIPAIPDSRFVIANVRG
jgi:fatty-acid peroxygenase